MNKQIIKKLEIAIDKVNTAITLKGKQGKETQSLKFILDNLYKEINK